METKEYIIRKNAKLNKDIVALIDAVPSFGYGEAADAMIKSAMTSYFLTLVTVSNIEEHADIEILFQSVSDDIAVLTRELIAKVTTVKHQIETVDET